MHQILGNYLYIASFDAYYKCSIKSVKSVQMMSLRRWLNGDGWGGVKVSKLFQILEITTIIASLNTYEGSVKSVKSVQMLSLRRWLNEDGLGGVQKY